MITLLSFDQLTQLYAVRQNGLALHFAASELKRDHEIIMCALKQTMYALQYVPMDLRSSKPFMIDAARQNGLALRYASKHLQDDREVVLLAVVQNGKSLNHASENLQLEFAHLVTETLHVPNEKAILHVAAAEVTFHAFNS